jgi:hypothetical protein
MNTRANAQKHDSVMTFVVMMLMVLSALAFITFLTVHDFIPAVQHFQDGLAHPRNN